MIAATMRVGAGVTDDRPAALRRLLERLTLGVLVTIGKDGRPQLSNVRYRYTADGPDAGTVRISVTDGRVKTRNLRRDPRAALHATDRAYAGWVVGEGDAGLTDVTTDPHDSAADALVALYRSIAGEHPDWDEFRAAMAAQRRLVVELPVTRVYGTPPGSG
jgi:PPOX class probable F420-dependent enzyme